MANACDVAGVLALRRRVRACRPGPRADAAACSLPPDDLTGATHVQSFPI